MLIRISRSCTVLLITAVFTLLASSTAATAAGRSILLVILDDFGMDKATFFPVGAYRKATKPAAASMPSLTRMAQGGVRFGNTWVQQECSPTRATILTGQYGFRRTNGVGE
jgi:arylsulfatase A-like enzyme